MREKDPFKSVIPEYVLIFIVLGFTLWLALGSITAFAIPLDTLKKLRGPFPVLNTRHPFAGYPGVR